MNLVTIIGLIAATCTTASFIPQAIETIQTRDTSGISLPMYFLFSFGTLMWLAFGIFSSNIPVSLANGITLIFSLIILFYKLKYK